jgi:hypothetical protein
MRKMQETQSYAELSGGKAASGESGGGIGADTL